MKNQVRNFRSRINAVKLVLILSVLIMVVKFAAWIVSGSDAILSDALESLINIATSGFTLFSLYYGIRTKDENHPYGHGKIEYFAVGFEGALILAAGIYILVRSALAFFNPGPIQNVEGGMILVLISGVFMFFAGIYLKKKGEELDSLPLIADGKHFNTDALTSAALIAGLALYKITGFTWIDPLLATLLALHIMVSGWKLLRVSVDRLMDKADMETITRIAAVLQENRVDSWIDIHNLRIQKFGRYMHVDCHMTLPFYYTLEQVHDQIKALETAIAKSFLLNVEVFVHTDPCQAIPCALCSVDNCPYRRLPHAEQVIWTPSNLMLNKKHTLETQIPQSYTRF